MVKQCNRKLMESLMREKNVHLAKKGEAGKESDSPLLIALSVLTKGRKLLVWPPNLSAGQYIVNVQPDQAADSSTCVNEL